MKKFFNLQMFADTLAEDGAAVVTPETEPKNNEPGAEPKAAAKYTDEDVDRIVARTIAKERQRAEKQAADERAKATEAERLAKMTAEEKANERLNAMQKQLDEYVRKDAVSAMTKEARSMLSDKGIHIDDVLLGNLIAEDAENTKAAVESFVSLFNSAVEKAVKEKVKGEAPKAGVPSGGITKEQIMSITNRAERQRLMAEHKDLF